MATTEGKMYLTALSSLKKLEIQYVPTKLGISRGANWAEIAILGRNNPIYQYTGGSNSLHLTLDFYSEQDNREDVVEKCRLLESWTMNNGFDEPPERIRLTFGRLFKATEIWLIESVDIDYKMFAKDFGSLPKQATVEVSLILDTVKNRSINDALWK